MPKKRKSWGPGFGFGPDDAQDEGRETNPGAQDLVLEGDDAQEKQILELGIWFLGRTMPRMKVEKQILKPRIWFWGRTTSRMKLEKQILELRIWFWNQTMPRKSKSWHSGFGFGTRRCPGKANPGTQDLVFGPDDAQDEG